MLPMSAGAADVCDRLARERGVEPNLRVRVVAGGCSGLTWDLEIGAAARPGDHRRRTEAVTVLVDPVSAPHLRGAHLDLAPPVVNGLRGHLTDAAGTTAVVVRGLLGRHACACGESFSMG